MAMMFTSNWQFSNLNKLVTLNDMSQDDEVVDAIAAAGADSAVDGLVPGATLTVYMELGLWPVRPTDRTDIVVVWTGGDENNPPSGAAIGVDKWDRPVT
jgi:hypothetical protein